MNNFLKTHRIRSKQALLASIRLTLQVRYKNMYLSLKNKVLHRKTIDFRDSRLLNRKKVKILYKPC